MGLSQDQIARYSRHLLLPEVGVGGQEKLCDAKVLCIGTGGLGSPLGLYLAAAGIGTLGLVDFDIVDQSNLQRQIMHGESTVGKLKVDSAKDRLADMNSDVEVVTYNTRLSSENALEIFKDYDIIVDGTDNFPTRYLANDAAVLLGKPYIYGCILRFEGQASVFHSKEGPCYRCLYPEPPPPGLVPSCAEGGVLGILPGIIGLIQATEVVKLILGKGETLIGRLMIFDALAMKFRELKLRKDKDCPICGDNPTITELIDYELFCGIPSAAEAEAESATLEIPVEEVKLKLDGSEKFTLVDVREPSEYDICRIDGSVLIPLGKIEEMKPQNLNGLSQNDEIILHCKAGVRSLKAVKALKKIGFENVKSMAGGIEEWSEKIDPSVPRY
ncbi:MAG TPA: molybdopterin-synthase adenylyltransferase MoeB [Nitrospinaceae bacterium]|jgi:adenylyltransferase/sulfurtransferase|nr:molybdopterin-synthase adenylyltransferase MoeB [Nitrospinaceae bacterium]MDP7147456.1 molybdopterin-synthase adenylyltransferase MoeB [Nitrospinaceae bacterium]HAX45948.1 molybdenum cofactor biosynthesis protein MoeB [Nitrospina sp.]HJO57805.1 molybdopterin-synthase adenylyltransferase MoeB [Nitrospinaceae bacterium]|tara:strand:- start:3987 stop:5144 length:1158 start_codon:yes stop_codon:yes gene_type:complete